MPQSVAFDCRRAGAGRLIGNGFNIVLQALPLDGKIVCREITDDEGQDTGGSSRGNRGVRLVQ